MKSRRSEHRDLRYNCGLRITWADGKTSVEALFYANANRKSRLTIQHSKLADAKHVDRLKSYWAESLDQLKAYLES